jgi:hypothetical protein
MRTIVWNAASSVSEEQHKPDYTVIFSINRFQIVNQLRWMGENLQVEAVAIAGNEKDEMHRRHPASE